MWQTWNYSKFILHAFKRRQEHLYDNIFGKLQKGPLYLTHCYYNIIVECFDRAIGLSNKNYYYYLTDT